MPVNRTIAGLAAAIVLMAPALARANDISVGVTLACDTAAQVESFVAKFDGDAKAAIEAVNDEENKANACIVAALGFIKGKSLQTVRNRDNAYEVTEILVVGAVTGQGFVLVQPVRWFTAVQLPEIRS